jgi:alpha-galactosidase
MMQLDAQAVSVEVDGEPLEAAPFASGRVGVGALELGVDLSGDGLAWTVANRSDRAVAVRRVRVELAIRDATGPVRMWRNGYQSWSSCDTAIVGHHVDPSTLSPSFESFHGVHHADQRPARDGEIRSEWVTVLADDASAITLGAIGGSAHDVTFRARREDGIVTLAIEAFLGGARLEPGERRALHRVRVDGAGHASPADAPELLVAWAGAVGDAEQARTSAPYQVGWCSWYHYFYDVTAADVAANLTRASAWPFDVFQVDDGYQLAIGDWLDTNEKFPHGLERLARDIAGRGFRPGIWLAPFLAAPDSQIARRHPDWFARHSSGRPLVAWLNPPWGGDGLMWALDTTRPEVQLHLEHLGRTLTSMGFTYLKLDFTFAPSLDGRWHDGARTPAERVRAGYDAVRRGAGDAAFILGCGVPLAHVVGVVDGNRIGADVAPLWRLPDDGEIIPGYLRTQPATVHALGNTLARSFMHRRLWLNDPDCLMLRTGATQLSATAARTWADVVGVSGGMALVSDDLALVGPEGRALLDAVVAAGRASDARASAGAPARCDDLLASELPSTLSSGPEALRVDLDHGTLRREHRGDQRRPKS